MTKTFLSFVILLALTVVCLDSKALTVDELIQGVNQARLTIQSGEVHTKKTVEYTARKTEAEIDAWIKQQREIELKNYALDPTYPNLDVKQYEKQVLIPSLNSRVNDFRRRTEVRHIATAFQILDPDTLDHPTLYKYKLTHVTSPDYAIDSDFPTIYGDLFILVYDTETQLKQGLGDITSPVAISAHFYEGDRHSGYDRLSLRGRSYYKVPADAKQIGKEIVDGAECHILSFINEDMKQKVHIWVDPAKEFCVRKRVFFQDLTTTQIFVSMISKQFQKFGDVWFPTIIEGSLYWEDGTLDHRYTTEVINAEFNVDFPKGFFKINKDFYRTPNLLPDMGFLQDSGTSPTETDLGFLLCGPKSLSRICELLEVETTPIELQKLSGFTLNRGTTMLDLKTAAAYKGLAPSGIKASIELLKRKKVPLPAIAYVNNNHFLVFESVDKEGVQTSDPARKYEPHLTWDDLSDIWRGDLLIFDKKKARSARQKQTPLAYTDTPVYDFGKVLGGSEIKHTFKIKNIGQKPLKIISVTETCACTATLLSQDEILPRKAGDISTVLKVPSGNRRIEESLLVFTDDPVQNTLTLTLKGEAFTPIRTFPTVIALGNKSPLQDPVTRQVSLHVQDEVQIRSVRSESEHLTATLKPKGGIPHVEVQILPTLPVGQFSHRILIDYTYKGQQTTHKFPVFGQVLGEFKVTPNRLFLGLIKDPASVTKTFTISSRDAQPFQITSVESDTKDVNFRVNKSDNETSYQVTMTLAPKSNPGELTGDVIINTSNFVQPTVRIPFFGIIADVK